MLRSAVRGPPDVEAVQGHVLTHEVSDVVLILRPRRVTCRGMPQLPVGSSGAICQTRTLLHNLKNQGEMEAPHSMVEDRHARVVNHGVNLLWAEPFATPLAWPFATRLAWAFATALLNEIGCVVPLLALYEPSRTRMM